MMPKRTSRSCTLAPTMASIRPQLIARRILPAFWARARVDWNAAAGEPSETEGSACLTCSCYNACCAAPLPSLPILPVSASLVPADGLER
jgi:hypothetical protein